MQKSRKRIFYIFCVLILTAFQLLSLTSCNGSKKSRALDNLSNSLLGDYTSEISFGAHGATDSFTGNAEITRSGTVTRLDIHSPEPYSGMSIEYDVKGLPSSVAVHFSGIDTTLPSEALSKVNSVAALLADDFASCLAKLSFSDITEYTLPEGEIGYCAALFYGGADITVYFSENGDVPYTIEYRGESLSVDIKFDSFNPLVTYENE